MMSEKVLTKYNPNSEFLLYKTPNGDIKVDVLNLETATELLLLESKGKE